MTLISSVKPLCGATQIFQRCEIKHFTKNESKPRDLSCLPSMKSFTILRWLKLPAPSHVCLKGGCHSTAQQGCHVQVPACGHRRHVMLPGGLKLCKGAVSPASTVRGV